MKKTIFILLSVFMPLAANAQMMVLDQTSFLQRLTLFLQEMEESVSQSLSLSEQTATAQAALKISQEAADRLKTVSEYVQSSKDLLELTRAGVRISQKLVNYKDRIMELQSVSEEEKYWILDMAMDIAEKAAEQATEGLKLAKTNATDAAFSDYERLQLIKDMKQTILSLESDLDDLYSRANSYSNYNSTINAFRTFTVDVTTFTN